MSGHLQEQRGEGGRSVSNDTILSNFKDIRELTELLVGIYNHEYDISL